MSLLKALSYTIFVTIVGKLFLKMKKRQTEKKLRKKITKPKQVISNSLISAASLKELITRHYLEGRYANGYKKVVWITSGGPVEFLKALGFHTVYPENHGAICGVRRMSSELSKIAEELGYSRDLCSYARGDIGSIMSGKTPVGKLPKPDLLVCCNNICQTVLYWYQVLAYHFKVPLIIIDTPFIYEHAYDHSLLYVKKQLEHAIEIAQQVAGKDLKETALKKAMAYSKTACELWLEIMQCGKNLPAPISAFDEFFFMAPIVDMRGEAQTVLFYEQVLQELKNRIEKGIGSITNEKKRLIWDNLPIWYDVRKLSKTLAEESFSIVASTYTNAWGELAPLIDINKPLDSMANVYMHPILNRSAGHKLNTMVNLVKEYRADGVILHNNRSCKPYSIGQIDQQKILQNTHKIPALLLEADHNDPRSFTQEVAYNRLQAFMEMIHEA